MNATIIVSWIMVFTTNVKIQEKMKKEEGKHTKTKSKIKKKKKSLWKEGG
jgi:hypothetical protein